MLVAFVVLSLCVAEMFSEGVPVADKGAKTCGQLLQLDADLCSLLFNLKAVQALTIVIKYA